MYISYLQYSTIQYSTVVGWRAAGGGNTEFRPGMQYSALGQCIVCTGRPVGRRLSVARRQTIILYRSAVISLLLAIILTHVTSYFSPATQIRRQSQDINASETHPKEYCKPRNGKNCASHFLFHIICIRLDLINILLLNPSPCRSAPPGSAYNSYLCWIYVGF